MSSMFGSQQTTTPSATYPKFSDLPPALQGLQTQGAQFLTGQIGKPAEGYPGQMVADIAPGQQQAMTLGGILAPMQAATAVPTANELWSTLSGGHLPDTDPYIQQIIAGLGQQKERDISDTRAMFTHAGATPTYESLSRAEAPVEAAYAGQVGNLKMGAYQAERARQMGAIPYGMALPQEAINQLYAGGNLQRSVAQDQLSARQAEWLRQQEGMWRASGMANPLLETSFRPIPQQTTTTPSIFSQLLGAGASAVAGGWRPWG